MTDYLTLDALDMAQRIKSGQVSARELLIEAQDRLARFNPIINAVVTPMDDVAETLLSKLNPNALFAGVPFLVKDLMLPFASVPMSNGSAAMQHYRPQQNGPMADRLNAAGLITFGKTSTSELGASSLVNTQAFGDTKNPWDLRLNSGGSSGGSSAAVAARIVPMAYASDGGGSIRLPASYCGIFGFKPSRGLNRYEDLTKAWGGAVVSHVVTVSVRDSAAYLDLVAGHSDGNYSLTAPPPQSYLHAAASPPKPLKIALITRAPTATAVHEDCLQAATLAARYCQALGHHVEEADWSFDGMALMRAFLTIVFRYTWRDVGDMAQLLGVAPAELAIELNTRFMAGIGHGIDQAQVQKALAVWQNAAERLAEFHQHFDVILTPTVATPPLSATALEPNSLEKLLMRGLLASGLATKLHSSSFLDSVIRQSLYQTPFTPIANITGQPAMSLPLYWDANGLPHGAHFMAARDHDCLLFQLAGQLETAHPWRQQLPPLCRF